MTVYYNMRHILLQNVTAVLFQNATEVGYFYHLYNLGIYYSVRLSSESSLSLSLSLSHIAFFLPYSSMLEHSQIIKNFKDVFNLRFLIQKVIFVWDFTEGNDQRSDKIRTQKSLI